MNTWTLLGEWGTLEYWLAPDGTSVYRRKVSAYNYMDNVSGAPMNARYECSLAHFETFIAGRMAI